MLECKKDEDSRKYLIIITEDMNNGEWLTDEVQYHCKMKYSRILCFNTKRDSIISDSIRLKADCKNLTYFRIQLIPRLCIALFSRLYNREKRYVKEPNRRVKLKSAIWMYVFASLYKSIISKKLNRHGVKKNDRIVFYSYWMSVQSLTAVLLKQQYKNSICITRCHNVDIYPSRTRYRYIEYQEYLARQNDYIFPISDNGADVIRRLLYEAGYDKSCIDSKIHVSRLGCRSIIHANKPQRDTFRIITCSTVTPVKRLTFVVDILNNINDVYIEWNHFGDGILREEFISKTKELNSNISFVFHGRVSHEHILQRFASGEDDLLLNVSSHEGVPVSIMEAYAAGLPVIATDVGGVSEILIGRQREFLISKDFDDKDVAVKIKTIINMNRAEYDTISKDCISIWKKNYDSRKNYEDFATKVYSLIEN